MTISIKYLFLTLSVIGTTVIISSLFSGDYKLLFFSIFFAIMGMIAFIQIHREENTICQCDSFWEDDGFCFRCGGKPSIDKKEAEKKLQGVQLD